MSFFSGLEKTAIFNWRKLLGLTSESPSAYRREFTLAERKAVDLGKKYIRVGKPPIVGKSGKVVDYEALLRPRKKA